MFQVGFMDAQIELEPITVVWRNNDTIRARAWFLLN